MTATPPRERPGIVVAVHDGDTISVDIDLQTGRLGINLWLHDVTVRLAGCNARELDEPGGAEAHANLAAILPAGTPVMVAAQHPDNYGGRVDALIGLPDGQDVTDLLIAGGWAARWNGRGPKPVPPWPRPEEVVPA